MLSTRSSITSLQSTLGRLLCRLFGHNLRVPWPGDRCVCLRCNRRWGRVNDMAWTPGRGGTKRPTDVIVADGRGAGRSITSAAALTDAVVNEAEARKQIVARSGLNVPGAGATVRSTAVKR